ncbi:hypothetical protein BD324DRAFT_70208 [Kockovaella imperatae]|uniref:Uncharacterized protein n=1 Tax=Kockovaella imperatae TaxID=4999 RepID=A0A1Y1UCC0_9TREE|nr:hypothetical protein BD324DRAFT_70208 [Kockovaella imperatae]ORX35690.1 hypothetical protein BD324DRAFT_70208 [Kockovaella imperatae]
MLPPGRLTMFSTRLTHRADNPAPPEPTIAIFMLCMVLSDSQSYSEKAPRHFISGCGVTLKGTDRKASLKLSKAGSQRVFLPVTCPNSYGRGVQRRRRGRSEAKRIWQVKSIKGCIVGSFGDEGDFDRHRQSVERQITIKGSFKYGTLGVLVTSLGGVGVRVERIFE